MSYIDLGYSNLMYKSPPDTSEEMSEDVASQNVALLTGGSIAGGTTKSTTGKIIIDWEKGKILISDGANYRVLIGEDGL